MRRNWLRILMLAWATFWFVIVAPGHTRGIVKLNPNGDCGCCSGPRAKEPDCPLCEKVDHPGGQPHGKPAPAKDPVRNCAICYLTAHLSTPPAIIIIDPVVTLVRIDQPPAPQRCRALQHIVTYRAMPPPSDISPSA